MILHFSVKKPIAFVFEHLSNMDKFTEIHPVIYKVEALGQNNYLIFEKLTFAFIPYAFTYPAQVRSNYENYSVTMRAHVMKLVSINIVFELKTEGDTTLVKETVEFRSFLPLQPLLKLIFKKQHSEFFSRLNKLPV